MYPHPRPRERMSTGGLGPLCPRSAAREAPAVPVGAQRGARGEDTGPTPWRVGESGRICTALPLRQWRELLELGSREDQSVRQQLQRSSFIEEGNWASAYMFVQLAPPLLSDASTGCSGSSLPKVLKRQPLPRSIEEAEARPRSSSVAPCHVFVSSSCLLCFLAVISDMARALHWVLSSLQEALFRSRSHLLAASCDSARAGSMACAIPRISSSLTSTLAPNLRDLYREYLSFPAHFAWLSLKESQ